MTRLTGHALQGEGAPYGRDRDGRISRIISHGWGVSGAGAGLCECGALSDVMPSASQRRQWHREHKAEVTA